MNAALRKSCETLPLDMLLHLGESRVCFGEKTMLLSVMHLLAKSKLCLPDVSKAVVCYK